MSRGVGNGCRRLPRDQARTLLEHGRVHATDGERAAEAARNHRLIARRRGRPDASRGATAQLPPPSPGWRPERLSARFSFGVVALYRRASRSGGSS